MSLNSFLQPRSIAVIGVSRQARKLGSRIFQNLKEGGFRGRLIPVNPNIKSAFGQRCYPVASAIPGRVDLAIIVTPAQTVAQILQDCGRARIRNVIVISAGFRESGPEGKKREQEIREIVQKYRLSLLGPNCLGFLHGDNRINASFAQAIEPGGKVALVAQSGALASALMDWGRSAGIGFRAVVSLGNTAGLTESDFLEYFSQDPGTRLIASYLESLVDGQRFLAAARQAIRKKPVVILKAGLSELGQQAARSHTGALASSREITRAALLSAGLIQVQEIREFCRLIELFSADRKMKGNRLALVTNAGGPGIIATDALAETKLELAKISPETRAKLKRILPPAASVENPIDLVGDADELRYRRALNLLGRDPSVDIILTVLTPQVVTQCEATAKTLISCQRRFPEKYFVASFLGGQRVAPSRRLLKKAGLIHFDLPDEAILALARQWEYEVNQKTIGAVESPRKMIAQPSVNPEISPIKSGTGQAARLPVTVPPDGLVLSPAVHRLMQRFGFRFVRQASAASLPEVMRAGRTIGFPVVLKLLSHRVIHKAKKKAVWLGIKDSAELARVFRSAQRAFPRRFRVREDEGWLIQRYLTGWSEWFVGGKRDPVFGPVILVGRGGTDVERQTQLVTLVLPFTEPVIRRKLLDSALQPWLVARDQPIDLAGLVKAVSQLGRLLETYPELVEIDLNPLLVGGPGAGTVSVDARAIARPKR